MSSTTSAISSALLVLPLVFVSACASGSGMELTLNAEAAALRHEQLSFETGIVVPIGQKLLTPEIRAREPFFEALVSWNVRMQRQTGMTVELRVRDGDDWSPWLFVGEWGAVPDELERVTEFDGGRIDVDFFTSDGEFDAIQLRFDVHGQGSIELRRFDLCLTGAQEPKRSGESRPSSRRYVCLDVPTRSQRTEEESIRDRICSPTTVAMVMEYRGVSRPTSEVARLLYDERNDIYGNWTRAIQGAYELGVPGYLTRISDWSSAERIVMQGQPLVASIRTPEEGLTGAPYVSTAGHLLVIVGFDEVGNVIVNDPAAETAEEVRLVYPRHEMEQAWMGKGGVAYVFLRPE